MEKKLELLHNWFEAQIAACGENRRKLMGDCRADEADFEKIKANVYDIFRTILSAAVKAGKGNPDAVKQFFLQKTEQIPTNWVAAYDKVKEHGNAEQMHIERIKLDTLREIKLKFSEIWEARE